MHTAKPSVAAMQPADTLDRRDIPLPPSSRSIRPCQHAGRSPSIDFPASAGCSNVIPAGRIYSNRRTPLPAAPLSLAASVSFGTPRRRNSRGCRFFNRLRPFCEALRAGLVKRAERRDSCAKGGVGEPLPSRQEARCAHFTYSRGMCCPTASSRSEKYLADRYANAATRSAGRGTVG
jgi:hypothetical protein